MFSDSVRDVRLSVDTLTPCDSVLTFHPRKPSVLYLSVPHHCPLPHDGVEPSSDVRPVNSDSVLGLLFSLETKGGINKSLRPVRLFPRPWYWISVSDLVTPSLSR